MTRRTDEQIKAQQQNFTIRRLRAMIATADLLESASDRFEVIAACKRQITKIKREQENG